ncbi:beta-ketoacyl-ACP synthase III [Gloeobacter morelensis]|uniref:Beta-ketoacyl-[acyl-carrier-protein] synthase III n=1 Tax=Gloeobacter morelensis MG652769 TaxID=2781736 RepID=A0ABY3PRS9_9CYAN|nr:beta-ketoacyl-ACP synthase III [Gloeobacter morelensis]UFP96325.1 ketoacyl-ACP synthase III [Gloeobacter morelensis MG652769]
MPGVRLTALGTYVPERVITNDQLAEFLETSDEWIYQRTGIRERRAAAPNETTASLAAAAGAALLSRCRIAPEAVQMVIVATMLPDHPFPATACQVQHRLSLVNAFAFDLAAACSGFVYALEVAAQFIRTGAVANALVIGSEVLTRCVDWTDRSTCVLFGDGAGAALLEASEEDQFLAAVLRTDGSGQDLLHMPAGGTALPATAETVAGRQHFLKMRGLELYQQVVPMICEVIEDTCKKAGLIPADLALVVPHQANIHIVAEVAAYLDLPLERFVLNIARYGNTSAASIPLALAEAAAAGRIAADERVLLVGFGAGLTCGATLIRWDSEFIYDEPGAKPRR